MKYLQKSSLWSLSWIQQKLKVKGLANRNFTPLIPHSAAVSSEKDPSGRHVSSFFCRCERAEGKQIKNAGVSPLSWAGISIILNVGTVKPLMWASTFSLYLCQDTAIRGCIPVDTRQDRHKKSVLWFFPYGSLHKNVFGWGSCIFYISIFHKNQQPFSSTQLIIDTPHFATSTFYLKYQSLHPTKI